MNYIIPIGGTVDDREELMKQMWDTWEPYNQAPNGKWRSYVVGSNEKSLLESETDCVTLVKGETGIYIA